MRYIEDRVSSPEGEDAPVLLVMLQGAYTQPEDFIANGFVAALRQRGINTDVVLADNDPRYVSDGSIVHRLHALITPMMQRGYRELWLIGISLGGFSALAYASEHGDLITGIHLIAPYPGTQEVLRPIREAGGLGNWASQALQDSEDDEHAIWRWLARWHADDAGPDLWFGTGEQDRFIAGQQMIAALLPPEQVRYVPGGHGWAQWHALWQDFLDHGPLGKREYRLVSTKDVS